MWATRHESLIFFFPASLPIAQLSKVEIPYGSLLTSSLPLMVDASGLIEALKRDNLDQRTVADHLMLLAKVGIRVL